MQHRNYRYGSSSRTNITSTTAPVQNLCHEAIRIANSRKMHCPDFGISRGYSSAEQQRELFKKGRAFIDGFWSVVDANEVVTNCDGFDVLSPHQSRNAIDFFAYVDGKANYEPGNLALIATCFYEAADNLGYVIEWGGNWKSMSDGPHIEFKGVAGK